jgi:hypothetical protein
VNRALKSRRKSSRLASRSSISGNLKRNYFAIALPLAGRKFKYRDKSEFQEKLRRNFHFGKK